MSSDNFSLSIGTGGEVRAIYDDALLFLMDEGQTQIARASHVEPNAGGQWEADLSPVCGPTLGPFTRRADALAAEVAWLETNVL